MSIRLHLALAAGAALLGACAGTPPSTDAATLLQRAEAAIGSAQLRTLVVSGGGSGTTFGQAWQPDSAWPGLNYSLLTRQFDFDNGAFREDYARSRSEPRGGGATPLMGAGEARVTGFARDGFAWNAAAAGAAPSPAPVALPARRHDLWTSSPHGALKAARRHGAVAATRQLDGRAMNTLSFTAPGELAATLVLDDGGLVTRIESTLPHAVLGDTPVVTEFADYQPVAGSPGLRFPMKIRQSQAGTPVVDWTITEVKADTGVAIEVPDNVRSARENVSTEKIADGVWLLAGGSHNSVAIELADQIVLVEAPLYDGRTLAVINAANQLVAGKKVQSVVNSHHHFDHAGGLRAAAAEGAQLFTSSLAKPYFERAFANPNRVAPDRLALSGRQPRIVGVSGSTTLRDPLRQVEIHEIRDSIHAQGFLMVWLPREKLLIEADAYTPAPPNAPPPPTPNANHLNLVQNIERLGLQPDRIVPLHGRVVAVAELYRQIGR